MPQAFHTLLLRVSHRERAGLKAEAKAQGRNLEQLLRARLGLPAAVLRHDGDPDPNELENLDQVSLRLEKICDRLDGVSLTTTLIADKVGISHSDLVNARRRAEALPAPEPMPAGFVTR